MTTELGHICGIEGCGGIPSHVIRVLGSEVGQIGHQYPIVEMEVRVCGGHFRAITRETARAIIEGSKTVQGVRRVAARSVQGGNA